MKSPYDPYSVKALHDGHWHISIGKDFEQTQHRVRVLLKQFNDLANTDMTRGQEILTELLADDSEIPTIFAPFHLEYGKHTTFGKNCFVNFNMVILDGGPVSIGDNTMFGPGCQIITASHPVYDAEMRVNGWEITKPITIGNDNWFGASVTVLPGVTIGDRCVIAAGSVVTKDIPDDSLVMGVPGRVTRTFDPDADPLERRDLAL